MKFIIIENNFFFILKNEIKYRQNQIIYSINKLKQIKIKIFLMRIVYLLYIMI